LQRPPKRANKIRPGNDSVTPPDRVETLLYIRPVHRNSRRAMSDSLLSLLNGDLSIWGVIAMPIGVAICFGPALFVWLRAELGGEEKSDAAEQQSPKSLNR